jgi:hypothetical protein
MKLLDILQGDDFDMLCEAAIFDDETYTVEEIRDALNAQALLRSELLEMLSDEQKVKAESYLYATYQYERVMAKKEFRRGFKMAVKLMTESMS